MQFRRTLLPALFALSSCQDEAPAPPVVPIELLDGGRPAADPIRRPDASCSDSIGLEDLDDDGFSRTRGDCDDCDPRRGPGAWDVPGNGLDEDCSGSDAPQATACDLALADDETDPEQLARALGLCGEPVRKNSRAWGLVSAAYERLGGQDSLADPRKVGSPERFGTLTPREGSRLLVLSTGVARDLNDDGYTAACDVFGSQPEDASWSGGVAPPAGFPRDAEACGKQPVSEGALAYDDVGLTLRLRAPANAGAFSFDSMFLSHEYPDFVCSRYNDFFVVLMDPPPRAYREDGNILFDAARDPIGVNSGLLAVCEASKRAARDIACESGPALLADTGYGADEATCAPLPHGEENIGGAATGWLHTEMPVEPGSLFTLRFRLWDSGDPLLDSSVLLDNFRFLEVTEREGTVPITSGR